MIHGLVHDPATTIQTVIEEKINCLVGIPVQLLSLARHPDAARIPPGMLKSVLLSTDYVPRAIVDAIKASWECAVFEHYGMTEMGYGGAMSCAAHEGYHLREADILFEIIDPVTLRPVPDGHWGEVVFTTLNHRAMPLIRYRTGDMAAFIPQPCPCGAGLRRMQWVQGRRNEVIELKDGSTIDLASLDEMLFALPNVVNFEVVIKKEGDDDHLQMTLFCIQTHGLDSMQAAAALRQVPGICRAESGGALVLDLITIVHGAGESGPVVKRKIRDERNL
jgi:phenylacetate-coenzyme A ligase PaaK-like adenylate-forming protein